MKGERLPITIGDEKSISVKATDKEALVNVIKKALHPARLEGFLDDVSLKPGWVYDHVDVLMVVMPCGQRKSWHTLDDIPAKSVPCPCGDPGHWMIKYDEEGS